MNFKSLLGAEKGLAMSEYILVIMVVAVTVLPAFEGLMKKTQEPFYIAGGTTGTRMPCAIIPLQGDKASLNCGDKAPIIIDFYQ